MTPRESIAESIVACFGFTPDEAERIVDVYFELDVLRYDRIAGGATLVHGVFWDAAPMKEALKRSTPSERS